MSSGSESDEDYVPEAPEQLSEEESANEETELQYENEVSEQKAKKRKATEQTNIKKKLKAKNGCTGVSQEDKIEEAVDEVKNPEEDKKREEDLWAKFLEGTDTQSKLTTNETSLKKDEIRPLNNKTNEDSKDIKQNNDAKTKEAKIFEFAGEKIVVENNVIKGKLSADSPITGNKQSANSSNNTPRGSGGISNILGQLGKKGKLSTLEKSKLDWTTYKKEEGIEEEIQSHNKGKQGYLERRDFLERADMRQYEIERDLRTCRRSNR